MFELIFVTWALVFGCSLLAGLSSFLTLRTTVLADRSYPSRPTQVTSTFWQRFPLIALNHLILFAVIALALSLSHPLFDFQWQGVFAVAAQILLLVVLDDAYFYFFHRALHRNPYLYRKIHHIHHRAVAPVALEFIYVHPLEWMIRFVGVPVGLGIIVLFNGSISVHAFWAFVLWYNLHEIDIHTGVRPILAQYVPLLATTEHHDRHHQEKAGNYASTFTIWDRLMGTVIS